MNCARNIEDTIEYLNKKFRPEDTITARIGMRTNGDLHLGNIFPIVSSVIIGKKLIELGYKYRLIVILVDQEINDSGKPFNELSFSDAESLADHSIGIIKNFISDLVADSKIKVQYFSVSETLENDEFCLLLQKVLERFPGTKVQHQDDPAKIMVEHDLLGALENAYFRPDLHILGADHEMGRNGGTSMDKRERYQSALGYQSDYLTLLTPLVLFHKKKMSKSANEGIFLSQVHSRFRGEYVPRLMSFVDSHNSVEVVEVEDLNAI